MTRDSSSQRIVRLTSLDTVLALIEAQVGAVTQRVCAPAQAFGATLAQDVVTSARPPHPIALRDGYAVEALTIADAGPYAPVAFATAPRRVEAGDMLPPQTDAVTPLDAVTLRGDRAEAITAIAPGEGVLPAGDDVNSHTPILRAGQRLRALDVAVLAAAGVTEVTVRVPRLRLACGSMAKSPVIDAALTWLARLVEIAGGAVVGAESSLTAALADDKADAVIAVGGTGSGRNDNAVLTLAEHGRVEAHGIAISPGDTAAFGFAGARPVLLIPGRLDAALAIWLLLGRFLVAQLAGGRIEENPALVPLKRKITSTIGMTEVIPVRWSEGMAEPLGSGYLSFAMLTQSNAFVVVPPDSEGFAAATPIVVRAWP
jgi:molybdopterin biosynthesis enzyme